ncbi:MAG: MBL fold metallo-hydrolase [Phototrophicales bacterium]|nr:MAG: MBL fold metallo-hydrolase [Phototrophicales bacterium]
MILRYFYDKGLAQASYLVGCSATGEAMIVDPMRDIRPYIEAAAAEGLRITHVTETHIHADYVSGSRELADFTGAQLYLSDMGTADWKYAFAQQDKAILVRDGDMWMVGNIKVEVLHTPGHTPEHISFMITDTAGADAPMGIFSGDSLFVGDVGRPDLLEEAAGMAGTAEIGARQQFATVARYKALPDYLQVWPAHGAGSACGKALGAVPSTTLGYEKRFNPAFRFEDEQEFVAWLLEGQPEAPFYFAQMKKVNKLGPQLTKRLSSPIVGDRAALDAALAEGVIVFDLRCKADFIERHVVGTISIPMENTGFINYVGWFVNYDQPIHLILPEHANIQETLTKFRSIGVDNIPVVYSEEVVHGDVQRLATLSAAELAERKQKNGLVIVDVRGKSEYAESHIAGAINIPLGYLAQRLNELPKDHTIVTQCASGYRSQIAASVLERYGFQDVLNLDDNATAWRAALPTE